MGVGGFEITFGWVEVEDTGTAGVGEGAVTSLPDMASEEAKDFSVENAALSHVRTFAKNSSARKQM